MRPLANVEVTNWMAHKPLSELVEDQYMIRGEEGIIHEVGESGGRKAEYMR